MKIVKALVLLAVVSAIVTSASVFAQQTVGMTDEHIERIKSNCQSALGTLGTIHANDAPNYINRNQTYFSISDKMMARLNSRLTLNRYDAAELVKIASNYDKALTEFRSSYKVYDNSMSDLLRINCVKQPVSFFDKVAETRELRQKVNESVRDLKELIDDYREAVETFKKDHQQLLTGERS